MQAVIFIGVQATGKSTFFQRRFFQTHMRLSLDLLRTRHREMVFLKACLETSQRFVVDNTNPTAAERARYIVPARERGFEIVGYYFQSSAQAALERNSARTKDQRIPDVGVLGTYKRLQRPTFDEGFDKLYFVRLIDQDFQVEAWNREL